MFSRFAISTRRKFGTVLLIVVYLFFANVISASASQKVSRDDEFDVLRKKWTDVLLGKGSDKSNTYIAAKINAISNDAKTYWSGLNKKSGREFLWADLTSTTISAENTYAYRRIYAMALAYKMKGCSLFGNEILRNDIISALEWMNTNRYVKQYNDWWDFQIGSPLELNNCIALMYDDLSEEQRIVLNNGVTRFAGDPTTDKGANRAWRAFVFAMNGILKKDASKIEVARNSLSQILEYVNTGEGYFADGSFIQHGNHPYNLGYGIDAISKLTDLMSLLDGSTWEITDPNSKNLYSWVYDAYEPFIYKGIGMDMVRGREMARSYREDYEAGFLMIGVLSNITQFAPSNHSMAIKSMIKYWINSNQQRDFFKYAVNSKFLPINSISNVNAIVCNTKIAPRSELVKYMQFSRMDRALKLGVGYGFGISMHSTRIANYEADIKNENKKGWHTADGMTYLYNADLNQFSNSFWPTVDNNRLPGTTILNSTPIKNDKNSDRNWVGGVSFQNIYGATGMDFHAYGFSLQAKKSWFMFDSEIVALGTGISSADNKTVETIVENRKLNILGDNQFSIDGTLKPNVFDKSDSNLPNVHWAHLKGNVVGSDIGYYFPQGANLKALRQSRTDNWNSICGNPAMSDTTNHTNNFLTLWFDHGANPFNSSYSYILLPNRSSEQVSNYARTPEIAILRNDTLAQAVKEMTLNIVGANFWTDSEQTADIISCNKKSAVMIKDTTNEIELSVSDPTQLNSGEITLKIDKPAKEIIAKDAAVTVVQLSPVIILKVNVKDANGRTFTAKFRK